MNNTRRRILTGSLAALPLMVCGRGALAQSAGSPDRFHRRFAMTGPVLEKLVIDGAAVDVQGECAPGFERVLAAFADNFRNRRELGASFCIYKDGKKVVDLWGGHRDPARSQVWTGDTLAGMASVRKGMLALGLHMLADQGKLNYDAPVAQYWPEFAQNGKERITVRQAISHHAAIHFCDACEPGDYFRWDKFVAAVTKQKPEWTPGTRGVYHTLTIIPILGHLIELASGQRPWDYMRQQITERLGVDDHSRMSAAELGRYSPDYGTEAIFNNPTVPPDVWARFLKPMGYPLKPAASLTPEELAQVPLMTHAGTARGVARMFAFVAMDGELDGIRIFTPRTIDLMSEPQWDETCPMWGIPMKTALGLLVNNNSSVDFGPNPKSIGTAGAGGSFGMADRQNRLAVSYSLNRWWPELTLGDRARALVAATYASL